jgi:hypothetical protein
VRLLDWIGYIITAMQLRPGMILFGAIFLVGLSTAAFPFIDVGTTLFQIVVIYGFGLAQSVTSSDYADTHHALVWCCALVPNLAFFLIPAGGIWLATNDRRRWCAAATLGWCIFYLACLFWLFPGRGIDL